MNIEELRSAVQEASGLIQSLATIQERLAPLIEQAEEVIRQSESVTVTESMVEDIRTAFGIASDLYGEMDNIRSSIPDLDEIRNSAQEIIDTCENINYDRNPYRQIDDVEERIGTLEDMLNRLTRELREAHEAQQSQEQQREQQEQGQEQQAPDPNQPSPTVEPHPGRRH